MRDVCVEEWREKKEKKRIYFFLGKIFFFFFWLMGWHGRANLLEKNNGFFFFFLKEKNFFFFFFQGCGGFGFWSMASKKKKNFFVFLNLARTITYKTTENKQKAIKCVGCLPRSARLKSLAWRLEGDFSTRYPIFHKETRASNWHSLPNHMWLS